MFIRKLFAGSILGLVATATIAAPASAQRLPTPGGFRISPQMAYGAMRGASQLGWGIGRYQSIQRYGRSGDPGPWPGLGPALGIRR